MGGDLQRWDPNLGIPSWAYFQLGLALYQQEVMPVHGHLRAGCFNSPVYSSTPASMQVPIGGGQNKQINTCLGVQQEYNLAELPSF